MTALTLDRPQETCSPMPHLLPDEYRLLHVLQERPLHPMAALQAADLTHAGQVEPTDAQRALLRRMCVVEGTIRIVSWAGGGYVMTGIGEARYTTLERQYGPHPGRA